MIDRHENAIIWYLGMKSESWAALKEYWLKHNSPVEIQDLLDEVVMLRGKVSFYESRINQMHGRMK
jgi:hypothetical protein